MKSFPKVLVTISALLSVASAVDLGSRAAAASSSMKSQVQMNANSDANINSNSNSSSNNKISARRLQDDTPWDVGTKVYNDFPNEGWWSGTITSFSAATGMYTVTWEDGSTDYYDDGDKIDEMVAYAQNDPENNPAGAADALPGAYPAGTPISQFEDGKWYDGVVVQFGSGTYTVKWNEDDEIEKIQSGAVMDQMVVDATGDDDAPPAGYEGGPSSSESVSTSSSASASSTASVTFSVGTKVSIYENEEWTDGEITEYKPEGGIYTVTWSEGTVDHYYDDGSDFEELKQAVEDGTGDDDAPPSGGAASLPSGSAGSSSSSSPVSGPKFPIGTPVSDYNDGEWVDGQVIDFQDGNYIVQWDDEDEIESYDSHDAEDIQELTQMVADGIGDDDAPPVGSSGDADTDTDDDFDLWEIGTRVAINEDDQLWYGNIKEFSQGEYTIEWDTGEMENIDNFDLVNAMVSNAATSPQLKSSKSGMSAAGKAFLSLFIISVLIIGSIFGYKFYEKRTAEQARERKNSLDDGNDAAYRDEPDQLPKII